MISYDKEKCTAYATLYQDHLLVIRAIITTQKIIIEKLSQSAVPGLNSSVEINYEQVDSFVKNINTAVAVFQEMASESKQPELIQFTYEDDIQYDSSVSGDTRYSFIRDLREQQFETYFPGVETNYDVTARIVPLADDIGVYDPESACSYFYFPDRISAVEFIKRLNLYFQTKYEEKYGPSESEI